MKNINIFFNNISSGIHNEPNFSNNSVIVLSIDFSQANIKAVSPPLLTCCIRHNLPYFSINDVAMGNDNEFIRLLDEQLNKQMTNK